MSISAAVITTLATLRRVLPRDASAPKGATLVPQAAGNGTRRVSSHAHRSGRLGTAGSIGTVARLDAHAVHVRVIAILTGTVPGISNVFSATETAQVLQVAQRLE